MYLRRITLLFLRIHFHKKMNLKTIFAKSQACFEYMNKVNKCLLHSIISTALTAVET